MAVAENTPTLSPSEFLNKMQAILEKIVQSPSLHSRWLNTLSMMEHIGSRKIHASQTGNAISEMVLRHASEEARHAAFFKKASMRVEPSHSVSYLPENLLCGGAAVLYFQRLDAGIHKRLIQEEQLPAPEKFLCYLYVTKMVEERAERFYGLYQEILEKFQSEVSLKGIIKEEEGHLREMNGALAEMDPQFEERSTEFRVLEDRLFQKFFRSLDQKIHQS